MAQITLIDKEGRFVVKKTFQSLSKAYDWLTKQASKEYIWDQALFG